MGADEDLKKIKRKVTRHYFQHGMWDIVMGIALMGWGIITQFGFLTLTGVLVWIGVLIVMFLITRRLHRWLIPSRAGYIKYTENRKYERIATITSGIIAICILVLFIYYVITWPADYYHGWKAWFSEYAFLTLGIFGALRHITIAYWWKMPRWYINAVLIFTAFATYHWLENPLGFWITGGIVFVAGIALFVRFLQAYPVTAEEGINVSQ